MNIACLYMRHQKHFQFRGDGVRYPIDSLAGRATLSGVALYHPSDHSYHCDYTSRRIVL